MRLLLGLAWVPNAALAVCAGLLGGCAADTFVGSDAAPAADGGQDGASDAPNGGDAIVSGGDAGTSGCACPSPNVCCVYSSSQGTTYSCATGSCPVPQQGQDLSALACAGSADCGGATPVCCIWRTNNVNQSACLAQCDGNANQVQLCDPSSPDPGCPATAPCSSNNIADWRLPQSFGTCGGVTVP